jgi:peptidoglycan/xylan/chitin deacetylase (PgdA/CDA1 family)
MQVSMIKPWRATGNKFLSLPPAVFFVWAVVAVTLLAGCAPVSSLTGQENRQTVSTQAQPEPPPADLRLEVIDEETGLPLGAMPVSVGDRYLMTDADGSLEFGGLKAGSTTIAARAQGYAVYRRSYRLEPGDNPIAVGLQPESGSISPAPGGRVAYLTIDDGPHRRWTPLVLDILEREGVGATFFLVGKRAERRPDLVRRIYLEGHSVANHTYSHDYKELYGGGVAAYLSSLADNERALQGIIGRSSSKITRPPGGPVGNFGPGWQAAINGAGYTTILWNISTGDGAPETTSAQMVEHAVRYIDGLPPSQPAIVLMHDVRPAVIGALAEIIAELRRRGYRFEVIDQDVPRAPALIMRGS